MVVWVVVCGREGVEKWGHVCFFLYFCSGKQIFMEMRKRLQIVCLMAVTALMVGCGEGDGYTIEGAVDFPELEGRTVYMMDMSGDDEGPTDSAVVVDGRFRFSGSVDEAWIAMLGCPETPFMVTVVVERGRIEVRNDSVWGTPLNDRMSAFSRGLDVGEIEERMKELIPLYYSAASARERDEVGRRIDSLEAAGNAIMEAAYWQLYNENRDNVLGVNALQNIIEICELSYEELDSIVKEASPMVAGDREVQAKLGQLKAVEATSAGKHYTDIEGYTPESLGDSSRKTVEKHCRLSDLIDGKVAVVDFYASWCGPCRNEIKDNLVPLWKRYGKSGLVVVGVNVWERGDAEARRAAHEKVMKDLGITYPQLVDSTRRGTDAYGVRGIPQIILIDKDGTIVARDLRGAAIEEAVVKVLGR